MLPPPSRSYVMNVTIARDAPDCFERTVVLVNGMHTPTLIFQQGTRVNVSQAGLLQLLNRLHRNVPQLTAQPVPLKLNSSACQSLCLPLHRILTASQAQQHAEHAEHPVAAPCAACTAAARHMPSFHPSNPPWLARATHPPRAHSDLICTLVTPGHNLPLDLSRSPSTT